MKKNLKKLKIGKFLSRQSDIKTSQRRWARFGCPRYRKYSVLQIDV